jgi:hypothetical protein
VTALAYITISTCFGVSSGGNNFRQSHPTWEDSVARPFQDWLKRVYRAFSWTFVPVCAINFVFCFCFHSAADVRKARALVEETGTPTDAAAPDEAAEADEPEQAPPQAAKAKKSKRTRRKTAPGNAGTAATPVLPAAAEAASDASGLGSVTLVPPPTHSATFALGVACRVLLNLGALYIFLTGGPLVRDSFRPPHFLSTWVTTTFSSLFFSSNLGCDAVRAYHRIHPQ